MPQERKDVWIGGKNTGKGNSNFTDSKEFITTESYSDRIARERGEANAKLAAKGIRDERDRAMKPHPRVSSALLRTHNATKML